MAPVRRYLQGPDVGRRSPSSQSLRDAFRLKQWRTQRKSDGTVRIEGGRFEVPSRFGQLGRILVRYARWDLGHIDLVDPRSGARLCPLYPLDKQANANRRRRCITPPDPPSPESAPQPAMAPLLRQLMQAYAATGLPPAYLPKQEDPGKKGGACGSQDHRPNP